MKYLEKIEKYNLKELSKEELSSIDGGDIIKRFGKWVGGLWKDLRCSCGEGYYPDYSLLSGPKW